MSSEKHVFVGFGFGAIQAGLFLYEAQCSGRFQRLVVAEVMPDVVKALRDYGGHYTVNIAHRDHIEAVDVGPVEIYDPACPDDRTALIEAIADAHEIATAVPSVAAYSTSHEGSIHRVLATGLRIKAERTAPRAVIYTGENNNHAAEILRGHVVNEWAAPERDSTDAHVRFLNTVIGKMSGVITDPETIARMGLEPVTPGADRAFLVEAFNRILISRIAFSSAEHEPPFARGIDVFVEKDDLLPFEEAKLYGHNAVHAAGAYLGAFAGLERMEQLRDLPGMREFLRAALVEESGAALIMRYGGIDPLFTPQGYDAYADDLIERMLNPFLGDTIARVARDPHRKLAWNDRLIGAIRLALAEGFEPRRYAMAAAAALAMLEPEVLGGNAVAVKAKLRSLWADSGGDAVEQNAISDRILDGVVDLANWRDAAFLGCQ